LVLRSILVDRGQQQNAFLETQRPSFTAEASSITAGFSPKFRFQFQHCVRHKSLLIVSVRFRYSRENQ